MARIRERGSHSVGQGGSHACSLEQVGMFPARGFQVWAEPLRRRGASPQPLHIKKENPKGKTSAHLSYIRF